MADVTVESRMHTHFIIFAALIALTLLSVGVTLSGVELPGGIVFVLGVACVQVVLIGRFLMHVWQDAAPVRWLLGLTVCFVTLLFAMTMLSKGDTVEGTEYLGAVSIGASPEAAAADAEH